LRLGNDRETLRRQPGTVLGAFAWGHPFLDGNGRAMLVAHAELCRRAGFAIDWNASAKDGYLQALTRELADPKGKHLDAHLLPLVRQLTPKRDLGQHIKNMRGLDGLNEPDQDVAYAADDTTAMAAYLQVKRARGDAA
jgi:cell filamentation protein